MYLLPFRITFALGDDKEAIEAAGYETVVPVVICNSDDYKDVIRTTGKQVEPGDTVMELDK